MPTRRLAASMSMSKSSAQSALRVDVQQYPYKQQKVPHLTEGHKRKRKRFARWVLQNLNKIQSRRIVFTGGKFFDLAGMQQIQVASRRLRKGVFSDTCGTWGLWLRKLLPSNGGYIA